MNFIPFKLAIQKQFKEMSNHKLFSVSVDKDLLWETYLNSFHEGTNPIFREKREYDCSCCRQFIKTIGNVVIIKNNELISIWDSPVSGIFEPVSKALSKLVKNHAISNIFLHNEKTVGTDKNFEQLLNGDTLTWDHFFVNLPITVQCDKQRLGTLLGESRSSFDVLYRGLTELSLDSVNTVIELIDQNTLYRGEEQKFAVTEFKKLILGFNQEHNKENYVWDNISCPQSIIRIRNTSIGTLLIDLSNDMEIEQAVNSYENVVAPTNYKRPTALVTKAMVDKAKKLVEELGYTSALQRRYAKLDDITINNVLFADRASTPILGGDLFDGLANMENKKNYDKVTEISIDKFISDILPNSKSVELMFENKHQNNLVSLLAPVDATSKIMFKWPNNFSWSYKGEVADSIKDRVKQAGGEVNGFLRCSLSWYNYDDLDLHMIEPNNEIYFQNKRSSSGGILDVDINASYNQTRTPVENIIYKCNNHMPEGIYTLYVHQYNQREKKDIGFEVEIEFDGKIYNYTYQRDLSSKTRIDVLKFKYSKTNGIEFLSSLEESKITKTVWGINTNNFHPVKIMLLSPNHWDNHQANGNKHYFFMLENCHNDESARGFYNEFLNEKLNKDRKVFELLGAKLKIEDSLDQLSGLGFSSTRRDSVLCKVTGSFSRIIKILF